MAWRQHGRFQVDPSAPRALGVCDRCGITYNLHNLPFQFDWRGNKLINLKLRVCDICYDKAQQQNRPVILPPDPVPVADPRVGNFTQQDIGISAAAAAEVTPEVGPIIED